MSENTQNLAEQIVKMLNDNEFRGLETIKSSLDSINQRLDKIENQIQNPKPKIQNSILPHVSQQKFTNLEEIAHEIIANLKNEKACPYEPTGKPCDHCSMCNSLGF